MESEELKSCPFCWSNEIKETMNKYHCDGCGASNWKDKWNTRSQPEGLRKIDWADIGNFINQYVYDHSWIVNGEKRLVITPKQGMELGLQIAKNFGHPEVSVEQIDSIIKRYFGYKNISEPVYNISFGCSLAQAIKDELEGKKNDRSR